MKKLVEWIPRYGTLNVCFLISTHAILGVDDFKHIKNRNPGNFFRFEFHIVTYHQVYGTRSEYRRGIIAGFHQVTTPCQVIFNHLAEMGG